jgi:formylmethanofuran dehydrogenase subunit D
MEIILNTGSTVYQGAVIKGGRKMTDEYTQEAAYCNISPEDFESLHRPWFVRVTNEYNDSVIVRAKKTRTQQKGEIFIPRGIWANIVVTPYTESTGSPCYKNLKVSIDKAEGPIMGPYELIRKTYFNGNDEKDWK